MSGHVRSGSHERTCLVYLDTLYPESGYVVSADIAQVLSKVQRMRNGVFVFAALILASCGSHTTSLDDARNQFLEARADYQTCMNSATGEGITNCEPKRLIVEEAERAYKNAMSSGVSGSPR
jgi:hypothetical protein